MTKGDRVELLDYLRIVAALSVAGFHYYTTGFAGGKVPLAPPAVPAAYHYGYLGVHLFFMISGFVIVHTARRHSAYRFLVSRIVRLWPAFFVCMSLTALAQLFWATPGMSTNMVKYAANLTMMPKVFGIGMMDGVYWTLLFEICFYFFILLVIAAGRMGRIQFILELWFLLLVVNAFYPWTRITWLNPYCLLFVCGGFISLSADQGWSPRLAVSTTLATGLVCWFAYTRVSHPDVVVPWIAAAIVLGCAIALVLCTTEWVRTWRLPFSRTLGAISYPFYLLHAHLGFMAIARLGTTENLSWLIPVTAVAFLLLAWLVSVGVERPVGPRLRLALDASLGRLLAWLATIPGQVADSGDSGLRRSLSPLNTPPH